MEKLYYFYIPDTNIVPLGVMESLLREDFEGFYDEAIKFYKEETGIENLNLQLTPDMNKAFESFVETSPGSKATLSGSTVSK